MTTTQRRNSGKADSGRAFNAGASQSDAKRTVKCAIYTRKSTDEGLNKEFTSLDAQRDYAEAYIKSQTADGWICLPTRYDDGGFTGGNMDRPALQRLMSDIQAGQVDCVVIYKLDRFSRSIFDFLRMMETFEKHNVAFVCVTQPINTATSAGRLMMNMLLCFAQFERETISERTRDKIAAARRKGKWSGGMPVLGYDVDPNGSKLVVNEDEAQRVRAIYELYLEHKSLIQASRELNRREWHAKRWTTRNGTARGGRPYDKCSLRQLITNVVYLGKVRYKHEIHPGEHAAIVDAEVWQRAQQMLTANGRSGGMHVRNKYGALLKGLLHCKPCGMAMGHAFTQHGKNRCYRYYVCYNGQKHGRAACPSGSLPAEQIEQFVVDRIRAIGSDPALRSATLAQVRAIGQTQVDQVTKELEAIERELKGIHSDVRRATRPGGENVAAEMLRLQELLVDAERREREAQNRLSKAQAFQIRRDELDAALQSFDPIWSALCPRERAQALRLLVQRVDYDGVNQSIAITFQANGLQSLERSTDAAKTA